MDLPQLAGYWAEVQQFHHSEPDWVLERLSAYSARAGEIRFHLQTSEGRLAQRLRTAQIDPFIEECDRQFKIASRRHSTRQFDWEMTRGAPS